MQCINRLNYRKRQISGTELENKQSENNGGKQCH